MSFKNLKFITPLIFLALALMLIPSAEAVNEFSYNESVAEQTTDSTSYIEALALNFTPSEQDEYLIIASGDMRQSGGTQQQVYVQLTIDGVEQDEAIFRPKDLTDWIPLSFIKNITLNSTESHMIKIIYQSRTILSPIWSRK